MPFISEGDTLVSTLKLKQGDHIAWHELRPDGAANQPFEFHSAQSQILFDLHHTHFVPPSFGLNGQDIVDPLPIEADIDFVGFDLAHAWNHCAKMILQGVTRDPCKDVYQSVVAKLGKKRLLVTQRVFLNEAWSGIGHFDL